MKKSQEKTVQKSQGLPPLPKDKNKSSVINIPQETKPFNALDYAKDGITKDQVLQFKTAFDLLDQSGNGKVEITDVKQAFLNLGFHHQSVFAEYILAYLEKKYGFIDFGEFIRLATGRLNEEFTLPQTNIIFTAFDNKGTGKYSVYDLKDTMKSAGEDISQEQVEKIFRAADMDGDGYVTAEDFHNIVTKNIESK